jgi:hypothetical protein
MSASLSLRVNRAELGQALKTLARNTTSAARTEAVLSFRDKHLVIHAPGLELKVSAQGEWSGSARVAQTLLANLSRAELPEDDPLPLEVAAGRLNLGPLALPCRWTGSPAPVIELPLDPPLIAILRITRKHTPEEIERAGLADLAVRAQKKKDELAAKACENLEPLGIQPSVILRLVEESLDRYDAPLTTAEGAVRL